MIKLLFLIFPILLTAQNPNVYAALGDAIYDNAPKIETLLHFKDFESYREEMQEYCDEVEKTKKLGYSIEEGITKDRKAYLSKLRALSKKNELYMRLAGEMFHNSMQESKSDLFLTLVNLEVVDNRKYKNEILSYYYSHNQEIYASPIIDQFLQEEEEERLEREKRLKNRPSKEDIEKEKIRRIRERDRLEKEALKKSLEEESKRKKEEILNMQQKELSY